MSTKIVKDPWFFHRFSRQKQHHSHASLFPVPSLSGQPLHRTEKYGILSMIPLAKGSAMDKNEKTVETVFDYLRWRGDLTFAQDAFNEVDNLIPVSYTHLTLPTKA